MAMFRSTSKHPLAEEAHAHLAPSRPSTRRRLVHFVLGGFGFGVLFLLLSGCITKTGIANDTLTITASSGADTIILRLKAGDPNTLEVDDGGDGTANASFDRQTFSKILVDGGAGDDVLRIDRSNGFFTDTEATTLSGGDGNDTLIGDIGAETLDGGRGSDFLDGSQGNDTLLGGDDADLMQWDPGDGSDIVEGGLGVDRLRFNGSNIGEAFALSANGGRVRFTRNVAAITMDMGGVETLDLTELGGADRLTVGNLAGTGLTTVDTNLAAFGGGDDGSPDDVVVPPGTTIGQDGPNTTVDGLGAQVRILAGAPTDRIHVTGTSASDNVTLTDTPDADAVNVTANGTDVAVFSSALRVDLTAVPTLEVNLGGGDDTFAATGNLAPLVEMSINGEAGKDTLLGGNGDDVLIGGTGADLLDGRQGNDIVLAGDNDDTIQWDPGDGSDTIDGGPGADLLQFDGSNIGETFDLSANGSRARFTRNVANITMDIAHVETLNLLELGGADILTVNDLSGTGLTAVNANLAASSGAADGSSDSVIVNGTQGDDAITIDGTGDALDIRGPAATLHITGTDPSADRLTVNGLAGSDTISLTGNAGSIILVNPVP